MKYAQTIGELLQKTRGISGITVANNVGLLETAAELVQVLNESRRTSEATALDAAIQKFRRPFEYGGLGYQSKTTALSDAEEAEVLFQIEAHILALNSSEQ